LAFEARAREDRRRASRLLSRSAHTRERVSRWPAHRRCTAGQRADSTRAGGADRLAALLADNLELGRRGTTVEQLDAVAPALGEPAAVFLIDDPVLGAVITRLAQEPEVVADVQVFLDRLCVRPCAALSGHIAAVRRNLFPALHQ